MGSEPRKHETSSRRASRGMTRAACQARVRLCAMSTYLSPPLPARAAASALHGDDRVHARRRIGHGLLRRAFAAARLRGDVVVVTQGAQFTHHRGIVAVAVEQLAEPSAAP